MLAGAGAAPPSPLPALRAFGDTDATRRSLYDNVLHAAQSIAPLDDGKHRLRLTDVKWADPERFSRRQRKQAVLTGGTLARRLQGTWVLEDSATGKELQRRTQVIARVPYLSSLGTFIHRGNEYTVSHQQRLRPGIFTRIKDNGELESHVNVLPGKGVSHRYFLDPEKGLFKIRLGQAEMPLLPLLQAMGATDREVRAYWGNDLYAANAQYPDRGTMRKLADRLLRKNERDGDEGSERQKLVAKFQAMELDPEVTRHTLGQPYDRLSKEVILKATQKLLQVSRRETDPDDRDHLAYQVFLGPEDMFAERIARDHGRTLAQLFRKVSLAGSLDKMPSGALTPQIEEVLLGSGLAEALEEINPAEVFDKQTRITRMGEGGIPNIDSIPDEARSVQPSHLGFIDPLRTPECYDARTEVMTRSGWKAWPEVAQKDELACLVGGTVEWHRPTQLHCGHYRGKLLGVRTRLLSYLVTPDHRLWVRPRGQADGTYQEETAAAAFGRPRLHLGGGPCYRGDDLYGAWEEWTSGRPGSAEDWAELVCWYTAAAGTADQEEDVINPDRLRLSCRPQAYRSQHARLTALLTRLGLVWEYDAAGQVFVLEDRRLAGLCRELDGPHGRRLPDCLLAGSLESRRRLYAVLLLAGGRKDRHGRFVQFQSSSLALAKQMVLLAFTLGIPSVLRPEPDGQRRRHRVRLYAGDEEWGASPASYYRLDYDGPVYCATVPGGLLYVRRDGTPGHWSGNSFRAGVDLHVARGARKGSDGSLYVQLLDRRGKLVWKGPRDLADAAVATPDVLRWDSKRVPVMKGGKLSYVRKKDIDFVIPHFEDTFSPLGNLVPLKSMVKGQRVAMGSRYITQALPLIAAEAPLVQSGTPESKGKRSFEEEYGKHLGAVEAGADGRVIDVRDGVIKVQYADGRKEEIELYDNYPFNRKTFIHQIPLVRPGDNFRRGQLLARSNYTDNNGAMALGVNARVAYWPYLGYNYEDAVVISEGMAKKMSSEHMYQHSLEVSDRHKLGKRDFIGLFPQKFERKVLDTINDDGTVKPGTVVQYGDPLILAARQREHAQNKVHRKKQPGYNDESVLWKHHQPGVVTDVVWSKSGPVVVVKSVEPMQVGDKMSGRYGDKGVVAAIVPDSLMPRGEDGEPLEVLLNPLGVITRVNPAQIAEAMLGKLARKLGRPIKVTDFEGEEDMTAWVRRQLERHGLKDTEDIFWPERDMKVRGIATGNRFFMKLHHTAECFDAATEALTARGWVPWPQVRCDDELATVRGGRLVFERPLRLIRASFRGTLYGFTSRDLDYLVTGNHRLYADLGQCPDPVCALLPAQEVHGRRFRVPQFGWPVENGQVCAARLLVCGQEMDCGDYAELVGWWAGAGHARVTPRRADVTFFVRGQKPGDGPARAAALEELLQRLALPWEYVPGKGYVLAHRPLAQHLRRYGGHARSKRLPRHLLEQPPDVLRRTCAAWLASCGRDEAGRRLGYVSLSRGLADDFQELFIRAGLGAIVQRRPPGPSSHFLPSWVCRVVPERTDAWAGPGEGRFWTKDYNGIVYCAEMETGLLYVRRNGKPMLSGNSKGQGRGGGAYSLDESPSKGGEMGCFLGDTVLHTDQGPRTIRQVVEGRLPLRVRARGLEGQEAGWYAVTDWFHYRVPASTLVEVELADGATLVCTRNHEFVLQDGSRKLACQLAAGDDLMEC